MLALAISAIAPTMWPKLFLPWLLLPAAIIILLLFETLLLSRIKLSAERQVRNVMAQGEWSEIGVTISNPSQLNVNLKVHDMHPFQCLVQGLPQSLTIKPNHSRTVRYELQAEDRGDLDFTHVDCQVSAGLKLLHRSVKISCHSAVKVFPNFKANRLYGLLLSKQHLDHLGIRRLPRQGKGSDFHQLREYRDGDSLRQIDWKATARMRKLIAREYAQERDQQIVFLLDCSMRMRHKDHHASHMDDTLNAIVLLAHVALQQGDATGIMTFGGVDRWIAPAKGAAAAKRLMQGIYDIQATRELPDYVQAVETLAHRIRRRALVILITNLRVEDGQAAQQALQRLKSKHLVLIADLRETDLEKASALKPRSAEEATLWLSAEGYRHERRQQHQLALASGARLVDVAPEQLSADLITRYLAIKRLGQL